MKTSNKLQYVPDEAQLIEISKTAAARHLHLITNGKQSALSPVIPEGWKVMRVTVKPSLRLVA